MCVHLEEAKGRLLSVLFECDMGGACRCVVHCCRWRRRSPRMSLHLHKHAPHGALWQRRAAAVAATAAAAVVTATAAAAAARADEALERAAGGKLHHNVEPSLCDDWRRRVSWWSEVMIIRWNAVGCSGEGQRGGPAPLKSVTQSCCSERRCLLKKRRFNKSQHKDSKNRLAIKTSRRRVDASRTATTPSRNASHRTRL